jgi:hypothetical protein
MGVPERPNTLPTDFRVGGVQKDDDEYYMASDTGLYR